MAIANRGVAETLTQTPRVQSVSDPANWRSAISQLNGSILQSWEWGEFKSRHGWMPHRLLVESAGVPVAAAQALLRPIGPMSVLYVPRGPAAAGRADLHFTSALTLALDRLARSQRAAIAFIEPDDPDLSIPMGSGDLTWTDAPIELQPLRTIKVNIDRTDDDILAAMKSKTRYNVRLAGRRGVSVREGGIKDIVPFYALLEETSERDEFGIHSIEYYADMLDVFGDAGVLLLAEIDGQLAAGAIVLQHGNEAIYMFGASSRAHQRHMPSYLLQFEAMRWARDRGCAWYDLWGIPASDTPPDEAAEHGLNVRDGLWGVYRFKQGFGGEIVSYPGVYERQYYPRLIRLWRQFRSGPGA